MRTVTTSSAESAKTLVKVPETQPRTTRLRRRPQKTASALQPQQRQHTTPRLCSEDCSLIEDCESSLAAFQGQYRLGLRDPTTNLDAGDLFFNTTSDEFKVYSGSAWQLTIPTSSNQTNINTVAGRSRSAT